MSIRFLLRLFIRVITDDVLDSIQDALADERISMDSSCWENDSRDCFIAFSALYSFERIQMSNSYLNFENTFSPWEVELWVHYPSHPYLLQRVQFLPHWLFVWKVPYYSRGKVGMCSEFGFIVWDKDCWFSTLWLSRKAKKLIKFRRTERDINAF